MRWSPSSASAPRWRFPLRSRRSSPSASRPTGEEREILEHGAVEGEVFHSGGLRALAADRLATTHDVTLEALVHKQLIKPHPAALQGEEAFRFHHLLLRDAAYEAIPKASRTLRHEVFAGWLESLLSGVCTVTASTSSPAGTWSMRSATRRSSVAGPRSPCATAPPLICTRQDGAPGAGAT